MNLTASFMAVICLVKQVFYGVTLQLNLSFHWMNYDEHLSVVHPMEYDIHLGTPQTRT